MLPLCCAEMITASGSVSDSTVFATSMYFASPAAMENASRCAAWHTPMTPITPRTATTADRSAEGAARYSDAAMDAAPSVIIGQDGKRNRRYHHASHGTYRR